MDHEGNPRGSGDATNVVGPCRGLARGGGQRRGKGPAGECYCPKCGEHFIHRRGVPCFVDKCPKCGSLLVRA